MLLKNAVLLQKGKEVQTDILIVDGKIAKIASNLNSEFSIDVHGRYVLPGLIDSHVHFRDPGLTQKEDFRTGSLAAAAGGVTSILDMPNTIPPVITNLLLEEKRECARKSVVNYGFHFGSTVDNISEIQSARNIASVKIFMNDTTGKLLITDPDALDRLFASGKTITVHAEGETMGQAIALAEKHSTRLYIAHVSSKQEIDMLRRIKQKAAQHNEQQIFAEVTPHHLFLQAPETADPFRQMKPPLKTSSDCQSLCAAIQEGIIDTVGTDHAPHTREEKLTGTAYGVPGIETMLPLLLNEVHGGRMTLVQIQELCSENPAKIFKLRNKGFIREGWDADLTVIDLKHEKQIDEKKLYSKSKWSPFQGMRLRGWPALTIVNGNIVFSDNDIFDTLHNAVLQPDSSSPGREVEYDL